MERIRLKDGTSWPDPSGKNYETLAWRFRYAQDSLGGIDFYCAAEVMEAFESLILHPCRTLKDVQSVVNNLRSHIKTANQPLDSDDKKPPQVS